MRNTKGRITDPCQLTPRQQQIRDLLIQGLSLPQVMEQLQISRAMITSHATQIYSKENVQGLHGLIEKYRVKCSDI